MRRTEIEARRESMALAFLSEFEGSRLVRETWNTAIIATGGMTEDQLKAHKRLCFFTLGLWLPVFLTVALLRRPGGVIISVDPFTGEVTIQELA